MSRTADNFARPPGANSEGVDAFSVSSTSGIRSPRVAGPNGAGKTTITERGLAHEWFQDCDYINPDLIAQDELGDWNNPGAVLRAAQLATERREACLGAGRSLAFEAVFSASDKPDFAAEHSRPATSSGYSSSALNAPKSTQPVSHVESSKAPEVEVQSAVDKTEKPCFHRAFPGCAGAIPRVGYGHFGAD